MVVYAVANARSFIYIFICKRHGSIEKIGHLCSHRMTLRVAAAKASKAMAHAMPMPMACTCHGNAAKQRQRLPAVLLWNVYS